MSGAILGIDPGLSGGMAVLNPDRSLKVEPVPVVSRKVGDSVKQQVDLYALANWLGRHRHGIDLAVIELVNAMPAKARFPGGPVRGMGATSAFNFGFTAGALQQAVASAGIIARLVVPQVWKRHFNLLGQPKDASRAAASKLFPSYTHLWARKKDDGLAEAVLLARYGVVNYA